MHIFSDGIYVHANTVLIIINTGLYDLGRRTQQSADTYS